MALKSIYDIEVNDAAFKRFTELFDKHKEALKKMPGAWAEVSKSQKEGSAAMEDMSASVIAVSEILESTNTEAEKLARHSTTSSRMWTVLASSSTLFANNIARAAQTELHSAELSGVVGGLLGAGGLYGLDRLALGAGGLRRTVTGLGTGAGAFQALGVDFNRYFNTGQAAQTALETRSDYSKRWIYSSLGINPDGMDTSDLALSVADRARSMFQQSDHSAQFAHARGLDQFFSIEDLTRMAGTSGEEWQKARGQYATDKGTLGLQDNTLRKWQDFERQLDLAGAKIKTTFIDGLTPLVPSLEKLSDGLSTAIKKIMVNPNTAKFIADMGVAAEHFADFVNGWLDKLGVGPGKAPSGANTGASDGRAKAAIALSDLRANTPGQGTDILLALAQVESSGNPNAVNKVSGAKGLMQLMPRTAAVYGVTDPFDPNQSLAGAARILTDYTKHYGGDYEKAVAAYNWGPGNLDKNIAAHGADWRKYAPRETQNELNRVELILGRSLNSPAQPATVRVIVENKTGADVNVTAAQVAQQR